VRSRNSSLASAAPSCRRLPEGCNEAGAAHARSSLALVARIPAAKFDVAPNRISLEADIYQDLDLDSIDAADIVLRYNETFGRTVDVRAFPRGPDSGPGARDARPLNACCGGCLRSAPSPAVTRCLRVRTTRT